MSDEIKIFRGQCLNCAAALLGHSNVINSATVFELARKLFDEGFKQKFLEWTPTTAIASEKKTKSCPKCSVAIPEDWTKHYACGWGLEQHGEE